MRTRRSSLLVVSFLVFASMPAAASSGGRLWVAAGPFGSATAMAQSPDGSTVFVTGEPHDTVAYNASTGKVLWDVIRSITAYAIAVSSDGSKVFATGSQWDPTGGLDLRTIAYNASTGTTLWIATYAGPGGRDSRDQADSIGVDPDGTKVFVRGTSTTATDSVVATIAYNAVTGRQLWVRRAPITYGGDSGPGVRLAVDPDGSSVVVIAGGRIVAYDPSSGLRRWRASFVGATGSVALDADGLTVFVTGSTVNASCDGQEYATAAYDASSGTQVWVARYIGPGCADAPFSMVVSANGSRVFVTGVSAPGSLQEGMTEYATVAYRSATGVRLWVARFGRAPNPSGVSGPSLAVSPDGSEVFLGGTRVTATPSSRTSPPSPTALGLARRSGAQVTTATRRTR